MTPEARLSKLGLVLPPAPHPVATYSTAVRHRELLYVSGHGPLRPDGTYVTGKVGFDLDLAQGVEAARLTGLAVLATVRSVMGSLDRAVGLIKVLGMVNATTDFTDHARVINGFSDLMVEVFGERGRAARSAVGMASLPVGIAVEVEAIFEVGE